MKQGYLIAIAVVLAALWLAPGLPKKNLEHPAKEGDETRLTANPPGKHNSTPVVTDTDVALGSLFSAERKSVTGQTRNNPSRLKSYEDEYEGLRDLAGTERKDRFTRVLTESSMTLSLDDLTNLCAKFSTISDWQQGLLVLGSRFAAEDPEKGIAWLKSLPDDGTATGAFRQFAGLVPRDQADRIFEFVKTCENRANASAMLISFGSGTPDLEIALKVVDLLNEDPGLVSSASLDPGSITSGFTNAGDMAGAIQIASHIKADQPRGDAYIQIVRSAARKDPEEAAKIVKTLPDEIDRTKTVPFVVNEWSRLAPEKTSVWIASLPAGPTRDAANRSASGTLMTLYPETSLEWAMNIQSDEMRRTQVAAVLQYARDVFPAKYERLKSQAGMMEP